MTLSNKDATRRLFKALRSSGADRKQASIDVRRAIDDGADVNAVDREVSPLFLAIASGTLENVALLVGANADLSVACGSDSYALPAWMLNASKGKGSLSKPDYTSSNDERRESRSLAWVVALNHAKPDIFWFLASLDPEVLEAPSNIVINPWSVALINNCCSVMADLFDQLKDRHSFDAGLMAHLIEEAVGKMHSHTLAPVLDAAASAWGRSGKNRTEIYQMVLDEIFSQKRPIAQLGASDAFEWLVDRSEGLVNHLHVAAAIKKGWEPGVKAWLKKVPTSPAVLDFLMAESMEKGRISLFQSCVEVLPQDASLPLTVRLEALAHKAPNSQGRLPLAHWVVRSYMGVRGCDDEWARLLFIETGVRAEAKADGGKTVFHQMAEMCLSSPARPPALMSYTTKGRSVTDMERLAAHLCRAGASLDACDDQGVSGWAALKPLLPKWVAKKQQSGLTRNLPTSQPGIAPRRRM